MNYGDVAKDILDNEGISEFKPLSYEELTKLSDEDLIRYISYFHVDSKFDQDVYTFEERIFGHYNPNILFDRSNVTEYEIYHFISYLKSSKFDVYQYFLGEDECNLCSNVVISNGEDTIQYNCDNIENLSNCMFEINSKYREYDVKIIFPNNDVKILIDRQNRPVAELMRCIYSYVTCSIVKQIGKVRYNLINIFVKCDKLSSVMCNTEIILLPGGITVEDYTRTRIGVKFKDTNNYNVQYDTGHYINDTISFANQHVLNLNLSSSLIDIALYFNVPIDDSYYSSLIIFGFDDVGRLASFINIVEVFMRKDIDAIMYDIYNGNY